MSKQPTKYKTKPKKENTYTRTIVFKYEPTYEERESIIRRCIYSEQEEHKGAGLRWIVTDKDMETVKIKFMYKVVRQKKK
jgi:hypothetical protein